MIDIALLYDIVYERENNKYQPNLMYEESN